MLLGPSWFKFTAKIVANSETLGVLPNAPLAYVVAQIVIDQIMDMDKRVGDVQAALRDRYPRFDALQGLSILVGPSGQPQPQMMTAASRWQFADDAKRHGVVLQQNSIGLHATDYSTHDEFSGRLEVILKAMESIIPSMFIKRLGRDPGKIPYMKSYLGLTTIDCEMEAGHLLIKYYIARGAGEETPILPPDLAPLFLLEKSQLMVQPRNQPVALLDTDRYIEIEERFNVDNIIRRFADLNEDLLNAFKICTSEHGMAIWEGRK